jgi:ABC-2 type transport system ATP-binding protein
VVEVTVADADRRRALDALGRTGFDAGAGSIVVPAPEGIRSLQRVLGQLTDAGIEPATVGLRKPTLDEAFLAVTGRGRTLDPAGRAA